MSNLTKMAESSQNGSLPAISTFPTVFSNQAYDQERNKNIHTQNLPCGYSKNQVSHPKTYNGSYNKDYRFPKRQILDSSKSP